MPERGLLRRRRDDRRAASAQRIPQLDLGAGVQRRGHVIREHQLGVGRQRAGEGEPLHLAAGQAHAAVADQRVGPAGVGDVGRQPGIGDRSVERARVVEAHVVGEGSRQHTGHLTDVRDLPGPQEHLRVLDVETVPAHVPGVMHQTGQCREQ